MPTMPPTFRARGAPAGQTAQTAKPAARKRTRGRAWMQIRERVLSREPLCRECAKVGETRVAVQVDHIVPLSRGGSDEMTNLQPLCQVHHDEKSARERVGSSRPSWMPKPAIPTTLVCGPPGSGKTTYVRERARAGDVVIDLDDIIQDLHGVHGHYYAGDVASALWERNRRIAELVRKEGGAAWIIMAAPSRSARTWWADKLGAKVVLLRTDERTCAQRLQARLAAGACDQLEGLRDWFRTYRAMG